MTRMKLRASAILQDTQSCIPLSKLLRDRDIILLLTPAIAPELSPLNQNPNKPTKDPFEPFGQELARFHPWVHHVPYGPRNGITPTHGAHIHYAALIIFVIYGPPCHGQLSQVELADYVRSIANHRPQIIVTLCNPHELNLSPSAFPTIVQVSSLCPDDLQSAASMLFQFPPLSLNNNSPRLPTLQNLLHHDHDYPKPKPHLQPQVWTVEVWNEHLDPPAIYNLWRECLPPQFSCISQYQLTNLLRRDGYAMHYVVRAPSSPTSNGTENGAEKREIIGFCATYTTYLDRDGEHLLGSLALLLVKPTHHGRGVGLSLHRHAMKMLTKTRGVCRVQLGSTFPRLLYGLPWDVDPEVENWFRKRGWPIHSGMGAGPGRGAEVTDWVLHFTNWPITQVLLPRISFKQCSFPEFEAVLEFVEVESKRAGKMGWYDEYAKLAGSMRVEDIVLGVEDGRIIAAALTYVPGSAGGGPVAEDFPWVGVLGGPGGEIGGVTCVCVDGKFWTTQGEEWKDEADREIGRLSESPTKNDAVIIRLLATCIRVLTEQGIKVMFVDGVMGEDEGFESMGESASPCYAEIVLMLTDFWGD